MKKEIYFTLDKRMPETLYAEYKGRRAHISLSLVPKIIEKKGILSYEEEIKLAEDYLKVILGL